MDAIGRPWQATTVQFDFNLPKRFDITYMDRDGVHKEVVVIHRAIYGSLERFIGTLIEHYGGAFPSWLAPVQAVVMPITDREAKYAKEVFNKCKKHGLRVELNDKSEKINHRIREAEIAKIPYILVVGARETQSNRLVKETQPGEYGRNETEGFFKSTRP